MKHSKRVISLILALTMICAMAITVSAASYNWMGEYGSSHYEVVDNCGDGKFSSTTMLDTADYTVYSDVTLYGPAVGENGKYIPKTELTSHKGTPQTMVSTTSGTYKVTVTEMQCKHYVDGSYVHTGYVYL